jgi:CO/xanthine dehydrogenase FAD-binding subunit
MKPAAFDYVAPTSLEAAVEALAAAKGDGKVMAGGQSLVPLLNFRMTRPSVVVDLRKIPGLSFIEDRGSTIAIGALTRHADVERSSIVAAKLPVMSAAMPHVAHLAIRNRGTSAEASRMRIPPPSIRCSLSSTTQRSRCRGRRAAATFRRNSYSAPR